MPAESGELPGIGLHVPTVHGRLALPQAVDIHDGHQVVQPVVGGHGHRLPDRPFGALAIPHQHERPAPGPIQVLGAQGHPHPCRKTLSQRTGGHIDPLRPGCGVTLQVTPEAPQAQNPVGFDQACLHPGSVQKRGRVPLGKNETIAVQAERVLEVDPHDVKEEGRRQVGGRQTGGGVPRSGFGRGPQGMNSETGGFFLQAVVKFVVVHRLDGYPQAPNSTRTGAWSEAVSPSFFLRYSRSMPVDLIPSFNTEVTSRKSIRNP